MYLSRHRVCTCAQHLPLICNNPCQFFLLACMICKNQGIDFCFSITTTRMYEKYFRLLYRISMLVAPLSRAQPLRCRDVFRRDPPTTRRISATSIKNVHKTASASFPNCRLSKIPFSEDIYFYILPETMEGTRLYFILLKKTQQHLLPLRIFWRAFSHQQILFVRLFVCLFVCLFSSWLASASSAAPRVSSPVVCHVPEFRWRRFLCSAVQWPWAMSHAHTITRQSHRGDTST